MVSRASIWSLLLLVLGLGPAPPAAIAPNPLAIIFPQGEYLGDIDQGKLNEPSGVVFHPARGTLFAVGDEGDICELKKDGTLIKQAHLRDADFEGITHDPATGLLYLAVEGEEKIVEVDPGSFRLLREFSIDRRFEGRELLKAGGQGIEAITFVPDSAHPQGGTFYVANQGFTFDMDNDPSVMVEVAAPIKGPAGPGRIAKIIRAFSIGVPDIFDLHYDPASGHLYAISDATNTFFEITRAGEVLRSYALRGDNQEGITIDDEGFVYVAQDSGGIIKFKWNRNRQATH